MAYRPNVAIQSGSRPFSAQCAKPNDRALTTVRPLIQVLLLCRCSSPRKLRTCGASLRNLIVNFKSSSPCGRAHELSFPTATEKPISAPLRLFYHFVDYKRPLPARMTSCALGYHIRLVVLDTFQLALLHRLRTIRAPADRLLASGIPLMSGGGLKCCYLMICGAILPLVMIMSFV